MINLKKFGLLALLLCLVFNSYAQDPNRFAEEIKKFEGIENDYPEENRIVFVGSSSIRFWVDFKSYFPDHNVINTGFGGSQTSDLLVLADKLVLKFKPKQVFVYEGDNDLFAGKTQETIMSEMDQLIKMFKQNGIENIVLISPKPSVARWSIKDKYLSLNSSMKAYADKTEGVQYADIWSTMMDENGEVRKDIFIQDNLHMNKKGYDLWAPAIKPFLINP